MRRCHSAAEQARSISTKGLPRPAHTVPDQPAASRSSPAPTAASARRRPSARAGRRARRVVACRDTAKGEAAAASIRSERPTRSSSSRRSTRPLESVRAFAERLRARSPRPADQQRRRDGAPLSQDRRRLRAAVRHQPPRALRAHRTCCSLHAPGARRHRHVAAAHKIGRDRLRRPEEGALLHRWRAYGQSKLANLLFASSSTDGCGARRRRAQRRCPPGLGRDQPADRRDAVACRAARLGRAEPVRRAERRARRRAHPVCRHSGDSRRLVRRAHGFQEIAERRRWCRRRAPRATPRRRAACGRSPNSSPACALNLDGAAQASTPTPLPLRARRARKRSPSTRTRSVSSGGSSTSKSTPMSAT